jgi:MFS transporter, PAT family, beta-lactamase induction signal transducer AmpG
VLPGPGVPLATLGLLSELTLAYKFKFVWAPFLLFVGKVFGQRRGWSLVAILAKMACWPGSLYAIGATGSGEPLGFLLHSGS